MSFFQFFTSGLTFITSPIQKNTYSLFSQSATQRDDESDLSKENRRLGILLLDQKKLQRENAALKDQFKTVAPHSTDLLPAVIIGAPGFVPGVSKPDMLIIQMGTKDGINGGEAVIVSDNLIGRISRVSASLAVVELLHNSSLPFLAKTLDSNATGVVSNENRNGLTLGNVILSEELKRGDIVVTKGNINEKGVGYPADLIVGRIVDVEKKASALFQTAQIKSLIDVSKLSTVFVIQSYK